MSSRAKPRSRLLRAGLWLKAADGLLELAGGVLLACVKTRTLDRWTRLLTQHELSEDPTDFVALHARALVHRLGGGLHFFAVLYLLLHGAAKLALAAAALQGRRRVYLPMEVFLAVFAAYAAARGAGSGEAALYAAALLDLAVAALLERERRRSSPRAKGRGS